MRGAAPLSLTRLTAGALDVWSAGRVLAPEACDRLVGAARAAPPDVDHRHLPLETLDGGAHVAVATLLVERLRAVSAYFSELRLQRAFLIQYRGEGDGHASHVDPASFTVNVGLSSATTYGAGELEFDGCAAGTRYRVRHERGAAILHAGSARHRATPLTHGHRVNLIIWCDRAPRTSLWAALPPALRERVAASLDAASLCRLAAASQGCAAVADGAPLWVQLRRALQPPARSAWLQRAWPRDDCASLATAKPPPRGRGARALLATLRALAAHADAHQRPARGQAQDPELAEARRIAARSRVAARVASAIAALAEPAEERRGQGGGRSARPAGVVVWDTARVAVHLL